MLVGTRNNDLAQSPTLSSIKVLVFFGNGSNAVKFTDSDSNGQSNPNVNVILENLLEWFKQKLQRYSSEAPVPICQEPSKIIAQEIMSKIRGAHLDLDGVSRIQINICAGHVFLIHKINDRIQYNGQEFFQQLPLFLEISVEIQSMHPLVLRHTPCQVMVTVEVLQDNNTNSTEWLIEEMSTNSLGAGGLWRNVGTANHPTLQP
ncbi:11415_t:CDS:2 [Ambispora gerdemannii]|uniref:11415_t:CDS:1 n=1 Tax=Ambispora gerdemannii TaxID=144530 RepID=A0A9N9A015_9GLOM|nr:11415_t:CDS:2 [Ambispora gerdemannii]